MTLRFPIVCAIVIAFCPKVIFSLNIDSLKAVLKTNSGNKKAALYYAICAEYSFKNRDSVIKYGKLGITCAQKEKDQVVEADILNSIGNAYLEKGEYTPALNNYITAEKIFEEKKSERSRCLTLMNIGYVYELQSFFDKALVQYNLALEISRSPDKKDAEAEALALGHFGSLYYAKNDKVKALDYFKEALKINQEINNVPRIMEGLNNVAVLYQELGKYNEALQNFNTDLAYARKMKIKTDVIAILHNIGLVYKDQKDYNHAISYIDSSIYIARGIKDFDDMREAYSTLSEIYKEQNNFPKALECFQLSARAKDSLLNQTRDKQFIEMSTKYETEKKEAENKLLKTEGEKQKAILIAISGGLVLVAVLAFFIYSGYRQKKKANVLLGKQNTEIKAQKHIIEEKQTEILDSIFYAKRLQDAILPPQEYINEHFTNNFVLYKPKDIVAGDFYWMEHIDNCTFFAAADSTGHGVPGAMVSVVCSNALNRSVNEFGLRKTGEILDKTRELVLETFAKGSQDVKDGMDISLLSVYTPTRSGKKEQVVIEWSGANNPLWYVSSFNGGDGINVLKEIKADKQPIGRTEKPMPFKTHQIPYQPESVFYLFTDGYPDQFGGPKGKKFKYKQLEDLISSSAHLPLGQQRDILAAQFNNWIGGLEQVDDVTVIGIKV